MTYDGSMNIGRNSIRRLVIAVAVLTFLPFELYSQAAPRFLWTPVVRPNDWRPPAGTNSAGDYDPTKGITSVSRMAQYEANGAHIGSIPNSRKNRWDPGVVRQSSNPNLTLTPITVNRDLNPIDIAAPPQKNMASPENGLRLFSEDPAYNDPTGFTIADPFVVEFPDPLNPFATPYTGATGVYSERNATQFGYLTDTDSNQTNVADVTRDTSNGLWWGTAPNRRTGTVFDHQATAGLHDGYTSIDPATPPAIPGILDGDFTTAYFNLQDHGQIQQVGFRNNNGQLLLWSSSGDPRTHPNYWDAVMPYANNDTGTTVQTYHMRRYRWEVREFRFIGNVGLRASYTFTVAGISTNGEFCPGQCWFYDDPPGNNNSTLTQTQIPPQTNNLLANWYVGYSRSGFEPWRHTDGWSSSQMFGDFFLKPEVKDAIDAAGLDPGVAGWRNPLIPSGTQGSLTSTRNIQEMLKLGDLNRKLRAINRFPFVDKDFLFQTYDGNRTTTVP